MNVADLRAAPIKIGGVMRKQGGVDILVFRCPTCKQISAMAEEGRHLCHPCMTMGRETWLQVERRG